MTVALDFDGAAIERERARIAGGIYRAERQAITQTTREAEQALEQATSSAGLGRLSKAWASRVFPRAGLAKDPVGYIYPKGGTRTEGAIRSFSRGGRVKGVDGGWTAIPTDAAGPRGRGRNLTPAEWEARTGQQLRPVYRPGRAPILVADGRVNARGRFRSMLKRDARRVGPGYGATVVIFVLMPEFNLQSRVSIEGTLAPFPSRLASSFLSYANAVQ